MSRDPLLYLDDIAQAADKITRSINQVSFEAFRDNDVLFDSVLFNKIAGTQHIHAFSAPLNLRAPQ